ncbi:hypothetical protein [Aestuariivirga sp.]|uniref:hypothetical protein n=1 Tax=Aestuariivirga sp. TaxID=2650926 RepID=UPI0039E41BF5
MSHVIRVVAYGVLIWMLNFSASMIFAGSDGFVHGDYTQFRAVMFMTNTLSAACLLALHFRHVKRSFLREGILVGTVWLEINLSLDFLVVVPRSGLGIIDYLPQIGIDYIGIPVLAILVGFVMTSRNPSRNQSSAKRSRTTPGRLAQVKRALRRLTVSRKSGKRKAPSPQPFEQRESASNVVPFPLPGWRTVQPANQQRTEPPQPVPSSVWREIERPAPTARHVPPPPELAFEPLLRQPYRSLR